MSSKETPAALLDAASQQRSTLKLTLSIKEMATATGLAEQTLYAWSAQGRIPWTTFKIGRRVLSRVKDVEAWLEAQAAAAEVQP
jgi:excisionase family DNA binding protein